jgi:hypothetical protein
MLAAFFAWLRSSVPFGPPVRVADQRGDDIVDLIMFWRPAPVYIVHKQSRQDSLYFYLIIVCAMTAGGIALWSTFQSFRRRRSRQVGDSLISGSH